MITKLLWRCHFIWCLTFWLVFFAVTLNCSPGVNNDDDDPPAETDDDENTDTTAPATGTAISYSLVTASSMRVNFGAATDSVTSADDLSYKIVTATTAAAINTVAGADAATTVSDWASRSTFSVDRSSLSEGTTYCHAVLVKDAAGNIGLYDPACRATGVTYKLVFTTTSTYTGSQIGGISGADAKCANDTFNTFGTTFKAMLVYTGVREACVITDTDCITNGTANHIDWPMAPSTQYRNARNSNASVGTTNAGGVFQFSTINLTNAFSSVQIWTGMNQQWDPYTGGNCSGWTANGGVSAYGLSNAVDATAISDTSVSSCGNSRALLCVEQ